LTLRHADRANAVEALLKGGADIEAVDDRGRTALCIAAKYGALDCINVLNEYGANHFHRDDHGLTALEIAEQSVRPEAAAQLKRMQQARPLPIDPQFTCRSHLQTRAS
jgi:ankyrin repeat protein